MQYQGVAHGEPIVVVMRSEGLEFTSDDVEEFRKWSALDACRVTAADDGTPTLTLSSDGQLTIEFPELEHPEVRAFARKIREQLGAGRPTEETPVVVVEPTSSPVYLRQGLTLLRALAEPLVLALLVVAFGWLLVAMLATVINTFATSDIERLLGTQPNATERVVRFMSGMAVTAFVFVNLLGIGVAVRLAAAAAERARGRRPRTWALVPLGTPARASAVGSVLSVVCAGVALAAVSFGFLVAIWAGIAATSITAFLVFLVPTALAAVFATATATVLAHLSRSVDSSAPTPAR